MREDRRAFTMSGKKRKELMMMIMMIMMKGLVNVLLIFQHNS